MTWWDPEVSARRPKRPTQAELARIDRENRAALVKLGGPASAGRLVIREVKADPRGSGTFEGYASTWDRDQGGDTIVRGAYARTLPGFLATGVICYQHDVAQIIGLPVSAEEDAVGLYLRVVLHSTPRAQEVRAVLTERLAAGRQPLSMSIGYWIPQGGASPDTRGGRIITRIELLEVSVVTLPMNVGARIVDAKREFLGPERSALRRRIAASLARSRSLGVAIP